MDIGDVLRARRKALQLTITAVAERTKVSRSYLSMIESGRRHPSAESLLRIVRSLEMTSDMWLPTVIRDEVNCEHLLRFGSTLFREGDHAGARLALCRSLVISRTRGHALCLSNAQLVLGRLHFTEGRYVSARRCFERRERWARLGSDGFALGVATYNLGLTMMQLGSNVEAVRKLDESIRLFSGHHMRAELGRAWLAKANALLAMQIYPQAEESYRRAANLLRGKPYHTQAALGVAITALVVRGPEVAMPQLQGILRLKTVDPTARAKARGYIAAALRWSGRFEDALQQLQKALDDREQLPSGVVAGLLAEVALCNIFMGAFDQVRAALHEYRQVGDDVDSSDIAVMSILAEIVGVERPSCPIPTNVRDGHERRLAAALKLLRDQPASRTTEAPRHVASGNAP